MRWAAGYRRFISVGAALLALAVACGDSGPVQPNLTFAPDTLPGAQLGRSYSVSTRWRSVVLQSASPVPGGPGNGMRK